MKTIILHNGNSDLIVDALFQQNQSDILNNVEIISIRRWISSFFKSPSSLYALTLKLKELPLKQFQEAVSDYGFLSEIQQDAEELAKYRVDIDALNIDDELKDVLKAVTERDYGAFLKALKEKDAHHILVADMPYGLFEQEVVDLLKENGAQSFSFRSQHNHHQARVSTVTSGEQFETAVQYIIQKDIDLKDCAFLLTGNEYDMAKTVLNRYDVPYCGDYTMPVCSALDMYAVLFYLYHPDKAHYLDIVDRQIFAECDYQSREYLRRHLPSSHLEEDYEGFKDEDKTLMAIQEKALDVHRQIITVLKTLRALPTFEEKVCACFEYLPQRGEDKVLLKSFLEENGKDIHEDGLGLFLQKLKQCTKSPVPNNGIYIGSFKKPIYDRKYLFVFNASSTTFPAFKGMEGLLKEDDLINSAYPSIEARTKNHDALLSYLNESEYTFYFNPLSTYDGKECPFAFALENDEYPLIKLKLIESEDILTSQHTLSKENARAAFLHEDGSLHGSISSFEKYFKCPYSYFLSKGLHLNKYRAFDADASGIGVIYHDFLKQAVKTYGQGYTDMNKLQQRTLLKPFFDRLKTLYPDRKNELNHLFEQTLDNINRFLSFCRVLENSSSFKPKSQEEPFQIRFDTRNGAVTLKGVIDRVDEDGRNTRILDYKSSKHTFNTDNIKNGTTLQLLTYVVLYKILHPETQAYGAFYLSFENKRESLSSYKYGLKTGLTVLTDDDLKEASFKAYCGVKNLRGMHFKDNHEFYTNRSVESRPAMLDFDACEEAVNTLYDVLYDALMEGIIPLEPMEKACDFCDFKEICRFKGKEGFVKREILDFELTVGKEEEE